MRIRNSSKLIVPAALLLSGLGQYAIAESANPVVLTSLTRKLKAVDGKVHDCFGRSLAISGDYLIGGAKGDDERANNSGAAYIFKRSGDEWVQMVKLKAGDAGVNDFFGFAVAISGDEAVVGAWQNGGKAMGGGAAYVFERNGEEWKQVAKLMPADLKQWDQFGYAVGISGSHIIVGAREGNGPLEHSGAAYMFEKKNGSWLESQKLVARESGDPARFGWSVAIDGETALVGAPADKDKSTVAGAGYAYNLKSGKWTLQGKLRGDGQVDDQFGYSVSISGDTVVIGAHQEEKKSVESGAAYVYSRLGNEWVREAKLQPQRQQELFGWSVGASGDTIVVGAWYDAEGGAEPLGSAYIYNRNDGGWVETQKVVAAQRSSLDLFGWAVAVSGPTVVVGARLDSERAALSGAVYVASAR